MLQYPLPEAPWDIVSIDLLQLPQSQHGSRHLLVCVDHLTRYIVLAPLKDKTATGVAHALVTHLFCPFSTPRVILSDNGAEFRNAVVSEICSQFGIKQTFTAAYHPPSNGWVERVNKKILEVLRPVVNELLDNWEDWLPHVAASLNSSVNDSTGKSPQYILFEVKKLPYDLLTGPQQPLYNTDSYTQQQLHVFWENTLQCKKLKATKTEMMANQHKRAIPLNIKQGDTIMIQQPERKSKFSPKFVGSYRIVRYVYGNKFEVMEPNTNIILVTHSDRLKKIPSPSDSPLAADSVPVEQADTHREQVTQQASHTFNLRPRH